MTSMSMDLRILPIAVLFIAVLSATWHRIVSRNVPDPYLDEFFHVRQAQVYCSGAFRQWDPKITTPPGLYLVSSLVYVITGRCDIDALRLVNVAAICAILVSSFRILRTLRLSNKQDANPAASEDARNLQNALFDAHSALNVALFPPLFFFSGLYYTDVVSTLCVLESYNVLLQSRRAYSSRFLSTISTVTLGVLALFFRQTNIFWVAIFPAGLAIFDVLEGRDAPTMEETSTNMDPLKALKTSWEQSTLYDCPVNHAGVEDYLTVCLSAGLVAVTRPLSVIKTILPYVALLMAFGGFVAWNGGVVLGDKSNHVATLHFSQMLYIWPYMFFFSFPLTLPLILTPVSNRLPKGALRSYLQTHVTAQATFNAPRITITMLSMALAAITVHYNTIIHPFTLADNRHYVFYVFRILRRYPLLKYFAVPTYYCCGWLAIHTLGISRLPKIPNPRKDSQLSRGQDLKRNAASAEDHSCRASFVIVWLVTTTLSVVTAPLVEPRYFIIPWIMWRLHVPIVAAGGSRSASSPPSVSKKEAYSFWRGYDPRLCLETTWYLAVNVVTAYMFLYRGFAWPQEPGKIQRFMW